MVKLIIVFVFIGDCEIGLGILLFIIVEFSGNYNQFIDIVWVMIKVVVEVGVYVIKL